jgi:hypothetical protein
MEKASDMDISSLLATTHLVGDTILTVDALRSAAACINERDRKPAMLAEHDLLCPPMGQAIGARVVPIEDGHHALLVEHDFFPDPREIELPFGEQGFEQQSEEHTFPFTTGEFHHSESFRVAVDPTAFGGIEGAKQFFAYLRQTVQATDFETEPFERRSVLPDPVVIFTLGLQASGLWLGVRLAKAAADALEPELKSFFQIMICAIKRTAAEAIPINRPVTYVLRVHGNPNLEFIARTRDANAVISAMAERGLGKLQPQINSLRDGFKAEMIQFHLQVDGTWAFNYLLTKDGKVVGTRKAFNHRAVVLQEMKAKRKRKKDG